MPPGTTSPKCIRLGNNLSAPLMAGTLIFEEMANAGWEYMAIAGSNPASSTTRYGRELSPLLVATLFLAG